MTEIAYHFTGDKLRDGRDIPAIGEWLIEEGDIRICVKGLHASRTPFQALCSAPGFLLHKVEVRDIVVEMADKLVARKRRIIATINAKNLLLSFTRKQALAVVHLFDCPRILKQWLETGDESILEVAKAEAYGAYIAAPMSSAALAAAASVYATSAAGGDIGVGTKVAFKNEEASMFNQEVEKAFEAVE